MSTVYAAFEMNTRQMWLKITYELASQFVRLWLINYDYHIIWVGFLMDVNRGDASIFWLCEETADFWLRIDSLCLPLNINFGVSYIWKWQ